jgi:triosephosphate isomerase
MKKIFINLKRFDVPKIFGGLSFTDDVRHYGELIIQPLDKIQHNLLESITVFLPEAHLITALNTKKEDSIINIGCQGVFTDDVCPQGNFGAYTTQRTAKSMSALGCSYVLIGHYEERRYLTELMQQVGKVEKSVISAVLNREVRFAIQGGLKVLFCIGERLEEQENRNQVLLNQLLQGLQYTDLSNVTIAYEPIWAIGPRANPPTKEIIEETVRFIKSVVNCPVVYGGGLKSENAEMLRSIDILDGGLIGLTRFEGKIGYYPDEANTIILKYLGEVK